MDWSHDSIPAMRLEARFGDRVVPAFCERPGSVWAMVSDAAARNPDGEALVCGDRRMTWREVAQESACVAAGLRKTGLRSGDRVTIEVPYGTFIYSITRHRIVKSTDLSVLRSPRHEVVELQACHPRFFASHRYIA